MNDTRTEVSRQATGEAFEAIIRALRVAVDPSEIARLCDALAEVRKARAMHCWASECKGVSAPNPVPDDW